MVCSGLRVLALLLAAASAARHDVARVHQHRASQEAKVVPREINLALRRAQGNAESKLLDFEKAEATANAAKEIAETTSKTKMSLMEEVEAKTTHQQAQAEMSRKAMTDAEAAASKHLAHSGDFEAAWAKWNGLSKDVEGMQENVTMMEEAIAKTLARMRKHLEALKDKLDAKTKERDTAEEDMMDKKGIVMSANNVKADKAKEAADAEEAAKKAQQELRSLQGNFDRAVSKAAKAEAEAKEAAGVARNAKNDHDAGKKTVELIQKLRKAVDVFYAAVDDFSGSDAEGAAIVNEPLLKTAFEKYNLMASAFLEVKNSSPDRYLEVKPSINEIERNYQAAIAERCDPKGKLMDDDFEPLPGFDEQCGSGLWGKVGMTRVEIPQ